MGFEDEDRVIADFFSQADNKNEIIITKRSPSHFCFSLLSCACSWAAVDFWCRFDRLALDGSELSSPLLRPPLQGQGCQFAVRFILLSES